jgi:hypothetical protein
MVAHKYNLRHACELYILSRRNNCSWNSVTTQFGYQGMFIYDPCGRICRYLMLTGRYDRRYCDNIILPARYTLYVDTTTPFLWNLRVGNASQEIQKLCKIEL